MKKSKKILLNILFCVLFIFLGGIILGIIVDDNNLAFTICFKIVVGYLMLLSIISFIKKVNETSKNIQKQKVKKVLRPITWCITILPNITLWGILVAIIFNNILNVALIVSGIALALYLIIILIVGITFNAKEENKEIYDIEKDFKKKK
ncbi:MAG: hypothetical protein IJY25_03840 [Bacilli bacterium]|nr:hypothetical protein [Bacilli bacterium]